MGPKPLGSERNKCCRSYVTVVTEERVTGAFCIKHGTPLTMFSGRNVRSQTTFFFLARQMRTQNLPTPQQEDVPGLVALAMVTMTVVLSLPR